MLVFLESVVRALGFPLIVTEDAIKIAEILALGSSVKKENKLRQFCRNE